MWCNYFSLQIIKENTLLLKNCIVSNFHDVNIFFIKARKSGENMSFSTILLSSLKTNHKRLSGHASEI